MYQKSNKGISLIALIITIIVIIILAAIVIGGVFNTPSQAKFSRWCNDVGAMQDAVLTAHGSRATQVATDVNYDRIDNSKIYKYIATLNDNAATEVIREKEMVKVDNDNNKLNIEIPKYEGQDWYIDIETGEIYMYPGFTHENRAYMSQADIKAGGITPPVVAVVTNLKITTTASASGTEAAASGIADGTNLWISFNATIEGETATVAAKSATIEGVTSNISGSLPYKITTNGSYTFTVSNTAGETTYTVNVTNYNVSSALLAEVAKVGDWVSFTPTSADFYPTQEGIDVGYEYTATDKFSTGTPRWRVWENDGTTVTLVSSAPLQTIYLGYQTPNSSSGTPTQASKGALGYKNGPAFLNAIAAKLYSKSGYTTNVRAMNYADIQGKLQTPFADPTDKYAYFKSGDSTTLPTGSPYQKKTATVSYNNITEPRFYEWDTGTGITYDEDENSSTYQVRFDESGTKYMTPTTGHPVYVTKTHTVGSIGGTNTMQWKTIRPTTDANPETHATSTSSYGDILGSSYSWLASPCVGLDSSSAYFYVRFVTSSSLSGNCLAGSCGNSNAGSSVLRPLVTLSPTVRVNTTDSTKNGSTSVNAWIIK